MPQEPVFAAGDAGFADTGAEEGGALLELVVEVFLVRAGFAALAGGGDGGADGAVEAVGAEGNEGLGTLEGTHYL